ncbi:MAG: purine-nucleoside phosphorylase [Bacillota bacterium]|nr:purine-nucleoside phosphorylase [Bacillota bacterium]
MPTPHNTAAVGDIAKTVLMPGDPLRAKYIAEHFLENPVLCNSVRNMFCYTGTYKGKPVSVMGSGMGMPSIGIYSYELFKFFGVERIIRVGSAGAYSPDLKLFDVVIVAHSWSESNYAAAQNGTPDHLIPASPELLAALRNAAQKTGIRLHEGTIHSSDVFYREGGTPFRQLLAEHGCLAVEMESFALFHNARVLKKQAGCLLTISDSLVTREETSAEQREKAFTNMIIVALEAI